VWHIGGSHERAPSAVEHPRWDVHAVSLRVGWTVAAQDRREQEVPPLPPYQQLLAIQRVPRVLHAATKRIVGIVWLGCITTRERISRWARMRRSQGRSSRRASGGSWHCLKSVVCTTDTNAALPDLPPQTLPPSARKARSVQPAISVCVPPRSAVPLRPRRAWKHRLCRRASVLGCPDKDLAKDSL
jgi:hypothetical protein